MGLGLTMARLAAGADGGELRTVPSVDPERYAGLWYEIARYPNRFQEKCAGDVTATYALRDDGKIDVVNECREANGKRRRAEGLARLETKDGPTSKLRVRFAPGFLSFLPFVWGRYWVIDLGEGYEYAVVGEPSRTYLWILSRDRQIEPSVYDAILARLRTQGYDPAKLVKTTHSVDEQQDASSG